MTTRALSLALALTGLATCAALAQVSLTTPAAPGEVHIALGRTPKALVQELHSVPLVAGENLVTVSWQDAKVDRASCLLRAVDAASGAEVGPLTFPAGQDKAVQWQLTTRQAGEQRFRLCYLLDGLTWRVQYALRLSEAGTSGELTGQAIVSNDSGQDFESARLRLASGPEATVKMVQGEAISAPYVQAPQVRVQQLLVYDDALYGDAVGVHYLLVNDAASGLGREPLASGKLRVQRGQGADEVLVGEGVLPYLPPGEKAEFLVAFAQDIKVTRRQASSERVNIRRDNEKQVTLFDLDEGYEVEIVSEREESVKLRFVEHVDGDWDLMSASTGHTQPDATSLAFELTIGAGETAKLTYKVKRNNLTP